MCTRFLLLLCLLTAPAVGQGFNSLNGRNHPELDWQAAETAHFKIMYPAHLAGLEGEAAAIAEASYAALSANLEVTFDEKLRLYLTDEDEIANGFAAPIGNGYSSIWVQVNDVAAGWTGREKWLRKVIAHELAHLFHYRAVRSGLGRLDYLFGIPIARFWTEGLAQYETETWDAFRGDRWLRTAVLDDRLNYHDGTSLWNGRLLYAAGNAQVRFFAEQYGDSTLARLFAHRKPVLLGLGRVHDFYTAFEAVTGDAYRTFYDRWRRHVNVYYNTLAGQMENPDSLGAAALDLPGQYLQDVRYSPDTTRLAVLSTASPERPVRRLYVTDTATGKTHVVAEGAIQAPVAWRPDGRQLAFARLSRGRHGSLLNDLFVVDADGKNLRRLTHSRRATSPTFSLDGRRLAFLASAGGTANVFLLDLDTGGETQVTHYTGDVQLAFVRRHPSEERLAFTRSDAAGTHTLVLLDLTTGEEHLVTGSLQDDAQPVWQPDGAALAYTSLRDDVPNVFVYDLATQTHRRVTHLTNGATVYDWLPPDTTHTAGRLVVVTTVSKALDRAYRIDAARTASTTTPAVPQAYTTWTRHRPPQTVPTAPLPDPALILARGPYRSWRNLTHALTFALPYYAGPGDWGLFGVTGWLEPLGKHLLLAGGNLSVPSPGSDSYGFATYVNNQTAATLSFNAYRLPGSARFYGSDVLVETVTGGDVMALWPLDWRARPYTATTLGLRLRYAAFDPLDPDAFETTSDNLPFPERGRQADLQLSLTRRTQRPYRYNVVHPLDGHGVRVQVTGAARLLGADTAYLQGDAAAFAVLPGLGLHRLFAYVRAQARTGDALAQDLLGLSRYDPVQLALPDAVPLTFGNTERVRGYRRYATGDRVLFTTVEYRVPLLPDLQTQLLGTLALGATTVAAFTDAALVWTGRDTGGAVRRWGAGLELKNALSLGGFQIQHALGIGQPVEHLGGRDYDLYYRIRAAVPF